jgi:hypothetical protein
MNELPLALCTFSILSIASCERRSTDRPRPCEHAPRVMHDCMIARTCSPRQHKFIFAFTNEWATYRRSSQERVIQTRSLSKGYPDEGPDKARNEHKSCPQRDSNNYICAVVCIADNSERWVISIWDVKFGALRHLTQPISGAPRRGARL